jgi:peptidyl-prolyl cis-trans isomerase B (cyclophilin B)
MVQGGGFDKDIQEKETRAPIANEADNGLKNNCYTLAMARTMDPDSASSQFFINIKDNDFLNHSAKTTQGWGYCVFATVTEGQEVIDKIKAVETGSNGFHQDVPAEPVIIEKVSITDSSSSSEKTEESNAEKVSAS